MRNPIIHFIFDELEKNLQNIKLNLDSQANLYNKCVTKQHTKQIMFPAKIKSIDA